MMTAPSCSSPVELTISCRNLINADYFSKSDPCCVVSLKNATANTWTEIGRTETIDNNLNPEFSRKIIMTYLFEERQVLRFDVYDIDSASSNMSDHDYLGSAEATLGEIVSSSGLAAFERPLVIPGRTNTGIIRIFAEEIQSSKDEFTMKIAAQNVPSWYYFGSYSYFFEIHKVTEGSAMTLAYRSPVITGKWSLEWPQFQLSCLTLCNGDLDKPLRITVYKCHWGGYNESLGSWASTVRKMIDSVNSAENSFTLTSGVVLQLASFSKCSHTTFLDFVRVGVQLHCFVGVDFTQSNGDPASPTSLHYINPGGPNQYQIALKAVLDIIQDYDSDKMFPALGFGAQIPPDWKVSHEFYLNLHPTNPYCQGVDGVMAAYVNALHNVRLYGPTNFAPIIKHVSQFAAAHSEGRNYFILLMITDGLITDMARTVDAIVAASSLPISIVIIGVGDADFSAMDVLDADDKPLVDSQGRKMERDIVQFVPISTIFKKAGTNFAVAQIDLAREVLAEIPLQFLSYMKKIGATPEKLNSRN